MNYRQRAYESLDNDSYNLKIKNSYYHFKNMQKINTRKPLYKSFKREYSPKLKITTTQPYQNHFIIRQNALYKKIIDDIKTTKVVTKINLFHQTKEEKLRDYRKQNKTLENRVLTRENANYRKRLKYQKLMLRIKDKKNVVLPPINKIVRRFSPKLNRKSSKRFDSSYNYGSSSSKEGNSLHQ